MVLRTTVNRSDWFHKLINVVVQTRKVNISDRFYRLVAQTRTVNRAVTFDRLKNLYRPGQ